jgi:hypothetical protein
MFMAALTLVHLVSLLCARTMSEMAIVTASSAPGLLETNGEFEKPRSEEKLNAQQMDSHGFVRSARGFAASRGRK